MELYHYQKRWTWLPTALYAVLYVPTCNRRATGVMDSSQ